MVFLPVILTFIFVFVLVLYIYGKLEEKNYSIKARLKAIRDVHDVDPEEEPLNLPFRMRVLKPIETKMINFFIRFMPSNLKDSVEKKLIQCGNPRGMKAGVFLSGIVITAIVLAFSGFFIPLTLGLGIPKSVLYTMVALLLTALLPALWLDVTAKKRVQEVDRFLPDAIDLLVVSVEAGLSFDLAMARVAERIKGTLGEEFARALNEMKVGKTRQAALRDITRRVESENLNSFLSMIIQGTQMGFAIGPILRVQSETMRRVRRQKAEELAMKAPVKMVFPMVFCIFPAIFVIVLGPAIINIMKSLKF